MGLPRKQVQLNDSDVQRHELHWGYKFPKGFEVMASVIVTCQTITPAGFIEDEGYQRPEPGEYEFVVEFEDISLFYMNMPIATDEQIENIVIPQLENLIELK